MPKIVIYILGLAPLAVSQRWLRDVAGDVLAFVIIIAYLIVLRLLAEKFGKARADED